MVAGTIAAGKTTLTQALSEALDLPAFTERPQANPFLERFYADPKRWALSSQLWFVSDTARQHVEIHECGGAVQDHSVYENVYVFGATLADEGKLQEDEWELLQETANSIIACLPPPALVLLVEAPAENLLERIAARARPYEADIDLGYLKALMAKRREFFKHWSLSPVLLIDSAAMDLRTQHQTDIIAAAVNEYLLVR